MMFKNILVTCFVFLCGCHSLFGYPYAIEVINENQYPLYGVLLESEKGMQFPFGYLAAGAEKYYAGEKYFPFRDKFTVSWSNLEKDRFNDFGEKPFSEVLDISNIPRGFNGVLQFIIDTENKVSYKAIPYSEYYGKEVKE